MNTSLLINARRLGQQKPLVADTPLAYPPTLQNESNFISLHNLICHIVSEEVAAFAQRQSERRFYSVMTERQIDQAAAMGKINAEPRANGATVEEAEAVTTALQAFRDGLFYFFVDDTQYTDLADEIFIAPNSTITIIRLVALAGG